MRDPTTKAITTPQVRVKMGGYPTVETAEQPRRKTVAFDGAFESCTLFGICFHCQKPQSAMFLRVRVDSQTVLFQDFGHGPPNRNGVCRRPVFDSGAVQRKKSILVKERLPFPPSATRSIDIGTE
uniref:Uncharacterized protein n=1 Tax=Moniliophthora roreri TaxID=221103 RepID=A0A0W0F2W0_MONRR